MKGVGYVLFVVAPKVLFHSTLGVLLVACLSYMCITIVAMMSNGGGQQGESYSLYMLISAAWFVPKMYESILANFASAIAAMWSILSRGYMKETWQCYIDLGTFIQEGSPSDERHDFWCMDINKSIYKGTGWKYSEWEESFSCSLIILVWSKRVLVFWDNWLLKSVFAFAPWVVYEKNYMLSAPVIENDTSLGLGLGPFFAFVTGPSETFQNLSSAKLKSFNISKNTKRF